SQPLYQQVGAIRGTNTSNTTLPWNTTHLTATSSSHAPGGDRVDLFVTPAPHLPVPTTYSQPPPYEYQQVGAIRGTNTSKTTLPWNTTHLTATSSSHAPRGDRVDLFVTLAPHLPVPTTYSQPPPYETCYSTHPGVRG
ncbi:hypothetical protein Tco_0363302, partial [Tanacetum coccineum]